MSEEIVEILARGVHVLDGHLLVCRTKGAHNTYLPGGHVDFGEGAKLALVREIMEEMGRKASVSRFLGGCDHSFMQKGEEHSEINLVFEMHVEGLVAGTVPESQEDHIEFFWVELDRVAESNLEPAILRSCLKDWLDGKRPDDRWIDC